MRGVGGGGIEWVSGWVSEGGNGLLGGLVCW